MAVLVIADHRGATLHEATTRTVHAALRICGEVDVVVLGTRAQEAAQTAATICGVRQVLAAEDVADLVEAEEAALVPLAEHYEAILAPSTSVGKDLIPRLAGRLDVAPISDVVEVVDAKTFVRPIYASNALETIRTSDAKVLATVRHTIFPPAGKGSPCAVKIIAASAAPTTSRLMSAQQAKSDRPELGSARIVVSGGRALGSEAEFRAVLEPLADKLGAAIGASRAAVDAGYAPNDSQIGQTGKIVAPDLYIAIGISGAIQHLAGIKDAKVIVAINKDPEAPIFQIADYGLIGEYQSVIPALMVELDNVGR